MLSELVFHTGLVAEQIRRVRIRTRHVERAAELGELHLERLEDPEHAVELSVPALEHATRAGM